MSDTPGKRRRGRPIIAHRRRGELLSAARKLLLEEGFTALTSARIAAKVGLVASAVNYLFRRKHDLLHDLFAHEESRLLDWLDAIAKRYDTLKARLSAAAHDLCDPSSGLMETSRVMLQLSMMPKAEPIAQRFSDTVAAGCVRVADWISSGVTLAIDQAWPLAERVWALWLGHVQISQTENRLSREALEAATLQLIQPAPVGPQSAT